MQNINNADERIRPTVEKTLFSYLLKPKWLLIMTIGLMLFWQLITYGRESTFSRALQDISTKSLKTSLPTQTIAALLLLIGINAVTDFTSRKIVSAYESSYMSDIRRDLYNTVISQEYNSDKKLSYDLPQIQKYINASESITEFYYDLFPIILNVIIFGALLFTKDWRIFATLIVVIVMLTINSVRLMANGMKDNYTDIQKLKDSHTKFLSDSFDNFDLLKYYQLEPQILSSLNTDIDSMKKLNEQRANNLADLEATNLIILNVGLVAVLYFLFSSSLKANVSLATLILTVGIYQNISSYLMNFSYNIKKYFDNALILKEFNEFLSKTYENQIKQQIPKTSKRVVEPFVSNSGELLIKDVNFSYGDRPIFKNLNLHVMPGEVVAIVGKNGTGKSTLLKLLYKFYDVDSGAIYIDNQDISNYRCEDIRSCLSIVPQETLLLHRSLIDNLIMVKPEATPAEIRTAIKVSKLDEIINRCPNGWNEMIGKPDGIKLSGGEKQRMSIARAVLQNKPILILDECLSGVDPNSAEEIWNNLMRFARSKNKTVIIIVHYMQPYMNVDRVIDLTTQS
jgi:ABC-type multidrug transport system fused ATPase/permease subunit